jgi:hypothetical protein
LIFHPYERVHQQSGKKKRAYHLAVLLCQFSCCSARVSSRNHHLLFQGITCLHVDVPDDEVICGPENPIHTLLPQEKPEPTTKDHLLMVEETVIFLRKHNIDIKPDMVSLPPSLSFSNLRKVMQLFFEHSQRSLLLLCDVTFFFSIHVTFHR